ncbi:flavin reductase [Pseudarthrobacter raffinosi]|uniref:flavin reductase n=1 Tax=Pseudarthrobacter raffinosi TaxID=2953651 RepID=UPI00208DF80F|nr:flavin reductase [Pseudarthrobacter sp. MDT3-9]MCO4252147.1 flavin reductase [Pseudarthrobacter sp. MDT3-9]
MSLPFDARLFREALGHYPTGVAVITGIGADGKPAGMVVGTFNSVSLDPPLIAFFPTKDSPSFAYLRSADAFCVNVLASDQEELCRRFATGKDAKFDGAGWRPSPLGAPILDGVVSWIECTFDDIRPAGDHFVALGLVQDFAVDRSTLPLLFFQGGYGRFTPRSLAAAPEPDLIQAAHLAEAIRGEVEAVSSRFGVNCSVLAKIGWDGVHVLTADRGSVPNPFQLGQRMPIIPPTGVAFMVDSSPEEIEEWLGRAPFVGDDRKELFRQVLDRVRDRGYSVLAAAPEVFQHHREVVTAFEMSDRLPRQRGIVQQATAELADLYEPDLVKGKQYEIESIVVPVKAIPGHPQIAIRMTGIAGSVSSEQVEIWIEALQLVAATAAERLR